MLPRIKAFFKKETVLCIAAICAVITMFFVPPDAGYWAYIDLRVLCLLLCLMAVVAGAQSCGAFQWLTVQMLRRGGGGRSLSVALVLLPFFSSMLVTNDVALLTFVPFTLLLLEHVGCRKQLVPMLVLQTVAANLGSMATPVGNPQNLFLYATYNLSASEFFAVTLPLTLVSLVCLALAAIPVLPKELPTPELGEEVIETPQKLASYGLLFVLCLLTVFHILPYGLLTVVVLGGVVCMDRKLLKELDIGLLATFVCFFIVSGNLGRVEAVRELLQNLLSGDAVLTAALTSQVISNVPAAVLLSGFTDNWQALVEGTNIGGLGTPIASLASLITLKLYLRAPGAEAGRFLRVFMLVNLAGLAVLLGTAYLL